MVDTQHDNSSNLQAGLEGSVSTGHPHPHKPSITRQILTLALPTLGATIAEPLFMTIDAAMVGRLGAEKIAGMSLGMMVLNTVYGMLIFLAYSTTSQAAQAMGAGRAREALQTGVHALWLALGLGVITAGGLVLLGTPLLLALGATPEVLPYAQEFLWTSLPGLVAGLVCLAASGALRGIQDVRTPLYVYGGGAILNTALNAFLIYGLHWGIAGSGAGTSITSIIMMMFFIVAVGRPARREGASLHPSLSGIGEASRIGAPLMLRSFALRIAFLSTIWSAAAISVDGLAAYQVVMSAWSIPVFLLDSLGVAAQTLVGFAVGAGDQHKLRDLMRILTRWGAWAGVLTGAVTIALSPWIPAFFVSESHVQALAIPAIIVNALFFPVQSVVFLLDGILIGAGRSMALAVASFANLSLFIPALVVFAIYTPTMSEALAVPLLIGLLTGLYMSTRLVTNSWIAWRSPRHSLVIHTS